MKTKLTKDMENCFIKEFTKMGLFICPEVGINIRRFGFSKRFCKMCNNSTEQELIQKGYKQSWHTDTEIVDILTWESNKNIWRCYELKVSLQDFKSNASKTFVGNYNYYLIPNTLLDKVEHLIPKEIGIYVYDTNEPKYKYQSRITCYKKAKKQDLLCTEQEIYYGMIKSLYREMKKYKNQV